MDIQNMDSMSDNNSVSPSSTYNAALTDMHYFVMWGLATIPCILSWFGSFSILYIARRKIRSNIYHRLLFIVSAIDFVATLWGYLNPILMNDETGLKLSMGNQATCTSVGFIIMFSVISKAFYSLYIALYFMLSVRYKWSDQRFKRFEAFAYLAALFIPLSYGIVGFINQAFNPNEFRFCSIAKYPIGCDGNNCIRGNLAPLISTISTCTTLFVSVLAIFCTILLFCFVRHQTKQSSRHAFVGTNGRSSTGSITVTSSIGTLSTSQTNERSRLVRTQSILYVAANINNFIWLILFNRLVLNSLDSEHIHSRDSIIFASGIFLFLFMPMYGFFNFCIYCYPRFRRIKGHFPDKPFWWCLRLLYTNDQGEKEISQQRLLQRNRLSRGNLDTSSGAISFSDPQQRAEQPQRRDTSKTKDELLELGETQSFHDSGDTEIGLPFDDDIDGGDNAILTTNSGYDVDQLNNKQRNNVTSTTLLDEEMMTDVVENVNNNKLYVDY